jgi:HEAT repeat protein
MTQNSKDKDMNALIKELFHAEKWQERADAARNLGFLKDGRSVNLICTALRKEEDHMVINRIIEALGRIGNLKATRVIIEKLKKEIEKESPDKYRVSIILEALMKLKDKRALAYVGYFLNSEDNDLKAIAKEAFDVIEPNWREIVKKEQRKQKSIQDVFKSNF